MGLHLNHVSAAFSAAGHPVSRADYPSMRTILGTHICPRIKVPGLEQELLDRRLERIVKSRRPDLILFASVCRHDISRLREYYPGLAVVWDYDGPRRLAVQDYLDIGPVDLLLTVSRYLERELKKQNFRCVYLPHGVDTDYYAPGEVSKSDLLRFKAPISYIGRATDRRAEWCAPFVKSGLALYGDRWRNYPACAPANRMKRNVAGRELVSIYRASDAMINILQEPLEQFRTILSIQCFAVPAAGSCLIAERTEEFPEAFDDGKEVLTFADAPELREHIERILRDPDAGRRIGEAGRRRCLAEHTHRHRVEQLMKILG